ncbi:MAG: hypothetical protein M0O96_11195 [Desulforhopalus sp.]|nr:hypothetical protein [Desulforhopalus sp.]
MQMPRSRCQPFHSLLPVTLLLLAARPVSASIPQDDAPGRQMAIQATQAKPLTHTITADHSTFSQLQFTLEQQKTLKPEDVTKACLSCHNQAALQFHQTIHWTWRDKDDAGNPAKFGKGGISVNNF